MQVTAPHTATLLTPSNDLRNVKKSLAQPCCCYPLQWVVVVQADKLPPRAEDLWKGRHRPAR